jgi:L-serine dehydratase
LRTKNLLSTIDSIKIDLYGSSLTGTGHATDLAVMLGLSGQDPEYIPVDNIDGIIKTIKEHQQIKLGDEFYSV